MGRIILSQPTSYWLLTGVAFCLAATVLIFVFFGTYTRHESVHGQLVPTLGMLPVVARSAGVVSAARVHEGQVVADGQDLIELSGEINSLSGGQTQDAIITDLQEQLSALTALLESRNRLEERQKQSLEDRLHLLDQQLVETDRQSSALREKIDITERRLERFRAGVKDGTFSELETESYQVQVFNGNNELSALRRQRLDIERDTRVLQWQLQQLSLDSESQRNELRLRLLTTKQALAQNEAQRAVVVRASGGGTVTNLMVQNGQPVTAGQRLLSILPAGSPLQAELWLPSRAAGFLEVGDRVVLRYPAFPYQKFGQQKGWVQEVARSATAVTELTASLGSTASEPLYRVLVRLEQQSVEAYGQPELLKAGMIVDADVLLDKRRFIDCVLEPLKGRTNPFY